MTVRLRTPEEKQVDSVTKALLHGVPDLVYLDSSTCAACAFEDEWVETGNFVLDKKMEARYFEDAMKNFRATNRPFTANAPQTHQGSGAART